MPEHERYSDPLRRVLRTCAALGLAVVWLLAGCAAPRWQAVADRAAAPQTDGALPTRIARALADWPARAHWTFFTTIHAAGHRLSATGVFDYQSPHDMRMTAITELGMILFDARMTAHGVVIDRVMPGLSRGILKDMVRDLALGFRPPHSLENLELHGNYATLTARDAEYTYRYRFGAGGRLRATAVDVGLFDTVTIQYLAYDSRGWPLDVIVSRPMRAYSLQFTFTQQPNLD